MSCTSSAGAYDEDWKEIGEKEEMNKPTLTVSSSPHLHAKADTASIMWSVSLALAPASLWGVYVFGFRSLLVLGVSILTALLSEYLLGKL